jgi:TRAP-type C4-dicarboxylate transport system permease small subunit
MDPESKKILLETLELVQKNNNILQSLRRSMRIQRIMSFLYWALIIGSAFGAYYFLQPYIDQLMNVYSGAGDILNNFKQLSQ